MPPPPPPPSGQAAAEPPTEPKFVGSSERPMNLTGETIEIPVQIGERARQEVLEAADPWDARHLYLNIEDISGETNPGTVYRMYLNLPPDAGSEELERHYLGELSFFGLERAAQPGPDAHPHGMRFSVEVGDLIRILRDDTDWDREQLRLCLRPVVPKPPAGVSEAEAEKLLAPYRSGHEPVKVGRVSLSIDA